MFEKNVGIFLFEKIIPQECLVGRIKIWFVVIRSVGTFD